MEITKENIQQALRDMETVFSELEYLTITLPKAKALLKQILELNSIADGNELIQTYTDLIDEIEDNLDIIQL